MTVKDEGPIAVDVLAIVETGMPLCFDCGDALPADPIVSGAACPCALVPRLELEDWGFEIVS